MNDSYGIFIETETNLEFRISWSKKAIGTQFYLSEAVDTRSTFEVNRSKV